MASHSNEALPQWIEGVNGAALEFSGGGEWILTEHRGLHRESDRTVAGWVRIPSDFGKGDPAPVMSWGLVDERPVVGHVWMLSLGRYFARRPKTFGRLWLSLGDQQIMGTTDLRDGKWHHVAAVLMNREEGPAALLYVDGNLENVQRNTIEPVETADGARKSEAIRFGRMIHYDQFYLRGGLDEFYLFDAALSGDQVRALMRGKTPKATTDP